MTGQKQHTSQLYPPANRTRILMTGGGAPGAAGILHCLQQDPTLDIMIADANPIAVGRFIHKEFEQVPLATDPVFINRLLELCEQKNIHVLLPLVTKELIPLAKHVDAFREVGTNVLVSPLASLEIANNKSRLYQFLEWKGIRLPQFRVVETVEQFRKATEELGYPKKSICFKPSVANGGRGFRIINEQLDELDFLLNHKPNSAFIRFEDAIRILSSGNFPELLVSEWLPGEEFSVDCLAHDGKALLVVPRLRRKIINGISVEGEFIQEKNIIQYCREIIRELQLHGNIGIQVKKSEAGEYLLLEINPRVQGTISAALGAGVNLPLLAVKQILNIPIPSNAMEVKWGTKFSRYWNEVFY